MLIEKILLRNFRVYQGTNEINLATDSTRNVSIVSGNNGFGKTSLLTSLVWCMYGKLMGDVDEKYRREIYEAGGYRKFCQRLMNKEALKAFASNFLDLEADQPKKKTEKHGPKAEENSSSFSVEITFKSILIPSIACERVTLCRTYNVITQKENIEVLIDGATNELTRDIGPEIFINDFVLPKEIAKFFFFDAEKIVSLAEITSAEEKKFLSKAYIEVLGLKKYLELRDNLENLRLRLKKKSRVKGDLDRLNKLSVQFGQNEKLLNHYDILLTEKDEELNSKRHASDKVQEQLIREGSLMTIEELTKLKSLRNEIQTEQNRLKKVFVELQELAPFAMLANKLDLIKRQIDLERANSDAGISALFLKNKLAEIKRKLKNQLNLAKGQEQKLIDILESSLSSKQQKEVQSLLNFSAQQTIGFNSIYDKIKNSYSNNFKQLVAENKRQLSLYNIINKKIQDSESKDSDPVVKTLRIDKETIDKEIVSLEEEVIDLRAKKMAIQNEMNILSKQVSELSKNINVEESDKQKDILAANLIAQLDKFIQSLSIKKKDSLRENLLVEINKLMHKGNFVKDITVSIENEFVEIELFDSDGQIINKEGLSKGEQQLYATALLKALINESQIEFPVFIDSPLQKFDKFHSESIVKDFYPSLSNQVIVFPLLEKEMNEREYNWLLPKVGKTYLIKQVKSYTSYFKEIDPRELFIENQLTKVYV